MTITTHETPDQAEVDKLRAALRAFNQSSAGVSGHHSLYIKAEGESGELIGGVFGKIAWQWLYIDLLWVHPDRRGSGLGTTLMESIEKEANRRGVFSYHLSTASFQAPVFYQKLGYQICGKIEGLPPGFTNYFMKKED